jgi:hypothetical protein
MKVESNFAHKIKQQKIILGALGSKAVTNHLCGTTTGSIGEVVS